MPPWMEQVGALIATYFASRIALMLLANWRTPTQRIIAAHAGSWIALALVSGLLEDSPFSGFTYLIWQVLWFAFDMARNRSGASGSRRSRRGEASRRRRRSGNTEGSSDLIGRAVAGVVFAITLGYGAWGYMLFFFQSSTFAEIPIGGGPQDALYVAGKPDLGRMTANARWTPVDDPSRFSEWLYTSPVMHVRFDSVTDRVVSITCREDQRLAAGVCPPTLGIGVGDAEWDIYAKLGPPGSSYVLGNGRKVMHYDEVGHRFLLERFKVTLVQVRPDSDESISKLLRFIVWLVP